MIAFITFNSRLVPMIEGLCSSNPWKFEFSGFRRNQTDDLGINCPLLRPTEPRLHVRSQSYTENAFPHYTNKIHTQTHTNTHKHTQIHTHTRTCLHAHACSRTHTQTHTNTYTQTRTHTYSSLFRHTSDLIFSTMLIWQASKRVLISEIGTGMQTLNIRQKQDCSGHEGCHFTL